MSDQTYVLTTCTRPRIMAMLGRLDDKREWEISVRLHRKRRSDSQNKRYWKLVGLASDVVGCAPAELHEQMLGAYFGWQEVNIGPKRFRIPKERSRVQDKKKFSEYMQWCESKFIQYCGTWLE